MNNTERMPAALRCLWWLSLAWGIGLIWSVHRPPLIDLPQHLAQVSLLRDLLQGQSPWSAQVWINPWTPYLSGYGALLGLSALMPMLAAVKALLTLAYLAFVGMSVALRRHFGAPEVLDWMVLPVFFGFAYQWGFLTFLVSAPIGLLFLLVADRWCEHRSGGRMAAVLAVGLWLLCSHGLMFMFCWGVGAMFALCGTGRQGAAASRLRAMAVTAAPFALLGLACAAYVLMARANEHKLASEVMAAPQWHWNVAKRLGDLVVYPLDNHMALPALLGGLVLWLAPWLTGWLPSGPWVRRAHVPFAAVVLVFLAVPHFALGTAFLFQRFGLLVFPLYGWLFTRRATGWLGQARTLPALAAVLLVLSSWGTLGALTSETLAYERESKGLDEVLSAMAPGQRALYLPLSMDSTAYERTAVYLHAGAYYQAERQGWVDFNFSWFAPQIVRIRPEYRPPVTQEFGWAPLTLDWHKHDAQRYRYLLFRSTLAANSARLMRRSPCQTRLVAAIGAWQAYEQFSCPTGEQTAGPIGLPEDSKVTASGD